MPPSWPYSRWSTSAPILQRRACCETPLPTAGTNVTCLKCTPISEKTILTVQRSVHPCHLHDHIRGDPHQHPAGKGGHAVRHPCQLLGQMSLVWNALSATFVRPPSRHKLYVFYAIEPQVISNDISVELLVSITSQLSLYLTIKSSAPKFSTSLGTLFVMFYLWPAVAALPLTQWHTRLPSPASP